MHITIEHREKKTGLRQEKREYYVETTVRFSEEERAIIELRGLHDHTIEVGFPTPPYVDPYVMICRRFWPIVGALGFLILISSILTGLSGLAVLLILGAIAMYAYGLYVEYITSKERKTVFVRELIDPGRFPVYAPNPSYAKRVTHPHVAEQLGLLKNLIMDCADMGEREVIEL